MQRVFRFVTCLLCLSFSGGCIVPYCAPKLDFTPTVRLDTPPGEVRAFRVDVTDGTADMLVQRVQRLSEIPVTNTDTVPAQIKPSIMYGLIVIGALTYRVDTIRSVAVRVYRPGFELIEINSWERAHRVIWNQIPDLGAQEKVLDRLFPVGELEFGSTATAHRDVLLFGSSEYERLATIVSSPEEQVRLWAKASKLRERAAK